MLMQQLSDSNKSGSNKSASNVSASIVSGGRLSAALVHQTFCRVQRSRN